jgi:hypothetical protein
MNACMPLRYFVMIGTMRAISWATEGDGGCFAGFGGSRRRRGRTGRDELRLLSGLAEPGENRADCSRRLGQLLRGRVGSNGVERRQTPVASVDPPAVADRDSGQRSQAGHEAGASEVRVSEMHGHSVEWQRLGNPVSQREDVGDSKRTRRIAVRQPAHCWNAWNRQWRVVALEARQVRMLLERALDGRRDSDAARAVAECGEDVRLKAGTVELRDHAANEVAKRLLAIRFEFQLDGDVHAT